MKKREDFIFTEDKFAEIHERFVKVINNFIENDKDIDIRDKKIIICMICRSLLENSLVVYLSGLPKENLGDAYHALLGDLTEKVFNRLKDLKKNEDKFIKI